MPKFIDTPPDASNEIKMLSKIGYTLESAISTSLITQLLQNAKIFIFIRYQVITLLGQL